MATGCLLAILVAHEEAKVDCFSTNNAPFAPLHISKRIAAENDLAGNRLSSFGPRIRRRRADVDLWVSSTTTQESEKESQIMESTEELFASGDSSKTLLGGMQGNTLTIASDATSVNTSADSLSGAGDTVADTASTTYRNGLITIGFITFLFASNSPALHAAFSLTNEPPPVLLVNAAVTAVGLTGVVLGSPFLKSQVPDPSTDPAFESIRKERPLSTAENDVQNDGFQYDGNGDGGVEVNQAGSYVEKQSPSNDDFEKSNNMLARFLGPSALAGAELGLYKFLGTTSNIYGLSLTSSDHGAFLIQLTTLLVPAAQGFMGVPIPTRIWTAIGLALGGVYAFTQDPTQADFSSLQGDALCATAAIFYALYDLRLFKWGKVVPTGELITSKMVTQSMLSAALLLGFGWNDASSFFANASPDDLKLTFAIALWSGLAVNCVAPYLQVSGQQAVGPARAQILYASQPLWAAMMGFAFLGERVGLEGAVGGTMFLGAMFLAATAENPDPECDAMECEV